MSDTPETVAYKLMLDVLHAESKSISSISRKEILDTFAECMEAIKSPASRLND